MSNLLLARIALGLAAVTVPPFALGANAAAAAGQIPAAVRSTAGILGDWQGEVRQAGVEPFIVTVRIASLEGSSANVVSYTRIDCTGHWELEEQRGATFHFLEFLRSGGGPLCNSVGAVTLVPLGNDRLHFTYHGGGVTSHGILVRD